MEKRIGEGWAVIKDGKADMTTVHNTRRAAIVNLLYVTARFHVTNDWPDERIDMAWNNLAPANGVTVAPVDIFLAADDE